MIASIVFSYFLILAGGFASYYALDENEAGPAFLACGLLALGILAAILSHWEFFS